MNILILAFFVVLLIACSEALANPVCKKNEEFGCGCADKVCNEPQVFCIRCTDGCFCKAGYVRDKTNGKCIHENTCPAPCKGQNEEFKCLCADKVCNEHQIFCIRCIDGCYCKDGFIRDKKNGMCIPENTCPSSCKGQNEEFKCLCADNVCNQPEKICKRCLNGCYCKDGFIRDKDNGICIPEGNCPVQCNGQNEEFGCGCADKVCNAPQIYCIQCLDGCFCKNGFVRDVTGGTCIPEKTCPSAN